jgi:DNA-binding transcriptional LysR family regulator
MIIRMENPARLAKIDLPLIKVLHTLLTHSVSTSALRLGMHQPAVSAALARLRGSSRAIPFWCARAARWCPPTPRVRCLHRQRTSCRRPSASSRGMPPRASNRPAAPGCSGSPRATSDPQFLPLLVATSSARRPCPASILPLSADFDYRQRLAQGEVDLVIGNWLEPPGELHLGRLFSDEIVCLVGQEHAAVRNPRSWTLENYLACDHIAPTPTHPGARGIIDRLLAQSGLRRSISVRCPHFALTPADGRRQPAGAHPGSCSARGSPRPCRCASCRVQCRCRHSSTISCGMTAPSSRRHASGCAIRFVAWLRASDKHRSRLPVRP